MKKLITLLITSIFFFILIPSPTILAADIIASNIVYDICIEFYDEGTIFAQSVSCSSTPTLLTHCLLHIDYIDIQSTSDWIRVGISETLDSNSDNWDVSASYQVQILSTGWYSFDFPDYVTTDTSFYLMIKIFPVSTHDVLRVSSSISNPYSGGQLWRYDGSWQAESTQDLAFYVMGDVNDAPVGSNPFPSDGASSIPLSTTLSVTVADDESQSVTATFKNYAGGETIGTDTESDGNGQVSTTWSGLSYSNNYKWYVELADPYTTTRYPSSGYFDFTTISDPAPIVTANSVSPTNGDTSTSFSFSARYTDNADPNVYQLVWREQGGSWLLTVLSGSGHSNSLYSTSITFPNVATYEYYYYFKDTNGQETTDPPETNPWTFTVSPANQPPNAFGNAQFTYNVIGKDRTYFYRGEAIQFNISTTDPENDDIKYGWDWNADLPVPIIDEWTSFYPSNTMSTITHTFPLSTTTLANTLFCRAEDSNGNTRDSSPWCSIDFRNHIPDSVAINGSTEVSINTPNTWYAIITDIEGDNMSVDVDWGDGDSNSSGWHVNGTNVSYQHIYTYSGLKTITFDIRDGFIAQSGSRQVSKYVNVLGPPNPPINIQIIPFNSRLNITWNEPNSGVAPESYNLYWTNLTNPIYIGSILDISYLNASDYEGTGVSIPNLRNGNTYNILMYSNHTTYGEGEPADNVTGTPGHTPPSQPVIDSPTQGEYIGQQFTLDWSEPALYDGAIISNYSVYYSTNGINYSTYNTVISSFATISGLTNGVTYYFKIQANDNQSASSINSTVKSYTVDDVNPTTPILEPLPTTQYSKTIFVNWSESTDEHSGINEYEIQEDDSVSFDQSSLVASITTTTLNHTFSSNHIYGRTYYFRIRAIDNAGNKGSWNGPVSVKLKTNVSDSEKYSKILEVWFQSQTIKINNPVLVTLRVEDKYTIPENSVTFSVGSEEIDMTLTGISPTAYEFTCTWEPATIGSTDFTVKVTNAYNAINTITIPIDISRSNQSIKSSLQIIKVTDNEYIAVTFSKTSFTASVYLDELNSYQVNFEDEPDETILLDLTNIESFYEDNSFWIFDFDFMDYNKLECIVNGNSNIIEYKIDSGYTITGYNDWWSKIVGIVKDTDFTLVEESASYIIVTSLDNVLHCEK